MIKEELNQVFAYNLQQKLKDRIYGKVYVKVIDDEIYISVACYSDIRFETTISNFFEKILNGYTTDYACYEVIEQYRKFVKKKILQMILEEGSLYLKTSLFVF